MSTENKAKPKAVIFDLEGTISDHSHRKHFWEKKDYDEYNKRFCLDKVNSCVVDDMTYSRTQGFKIIILTAKSEDYLSSVLSWLDDNHIRHLIDIIIMRGKLDSRPSVIVKKEKAIELMRHYDIVKAVDDREDICDMFEELEIDAICVSSAPQNTTPAGILSESADLFRQRNKEYGSSYKEFGSVMVAFFPDGLTLKTENDFARFAIFNMVAGKLDRYARNFSKGGHSDSLMDISVYSAMLQDLDKQS